MQESKEVNNTESNIDLTNELCDLIKFISNVSCAIRMNSPYSSYYNEALSGLKNQTPISLIKDMFLKRHDANKNKDIDKIGNDVLVLSDLLQQMGQLSDDIKSEDYQLIVHSSQTLMKRLSEPTYPDRDTFERWKSTLMIDHGISTLNNITEKARTAIGPDIDLIEIIKSHFYFDKLVRQRKREDAIVNTTKDINRFH